MKPTIRKETCQQCRETNGVPFDPIDEKNWNRNNITCVVRTSANKTLKFKYVSNKITEVPKSCMCCEQQTKYIETQINKKGKSDE